MSNLIALQEFATFHDLERDPFGRCFFLADVIIRAGGRGGAENTDARISFASGDNEQLVLGPGSVLVPGELPLGYSTNFGVWTHQDGLLIIEGNYARKFNYITEVRPAT